MFYWKNRYTLFVSTLFVSTDSVGHVTFLINLERYQCQRQIVICRPSTFCDWWLLIQLKCHIYMECCFGCSQSVMVSLIVFVHLNKIFRYMLSWREWWSAMYKFDFCIGSVFDILQLQWQTKTYALTVWNKKTCIDDMMKCSALLRIFYPT